MRLKCDWQLLFQGLTPFHFKRRPGAADGIWIWRPIFRHTGRLGGAGWRPQRPCISAGHGI